MTEPINDFSELIEYLDDKFQQVATKAYVDEKLDEKLEEKLEEKLNEKLAPLPTKSYIDEKFADLEGDLIVKLRKEDRKVNRLLELLKQKEVLTESEIQELASLQVFPKQNQPIPTQRLPVALT